MIYIESPKDYPSVFSAGGITNCPNWQKEFSELFNEHSTNYSV